VRDASVSRQHHRIEEHDETWLDFVTVNRRHAQA